ncbi:uncharacterized protein TRAVEDRAFT_41584 [Trametes versicolor FP-101664 SS1]|uniref:uncharacterized protein n=1 Tax=Trametes versicolor (strain FP-101664) TaxID=717944 RepID=UPI00046248CE|nr:uncharacterized protein TRAVEDRAFT_41584 [Trametes versicolor FP-101664 SS1]EIW64168.1 hypothetical protein TRAVEDRAFT_41584 [Trametes versicolor FP-101664 SS1]
MASASTSTSAPAPAPVPVSAPQPHPASFDTSYQDTFDAPGHLREPSTHVRCAAAGPSRAAYSAPSRTGQSRIAAARPRAQNGHKPLPPGGFAATLREHVLLRAGETKTADSTYGSELECDVQGHGDTGRSCTGVRALNGAEAVERVHP